MKMHVSKILSPHMTMFKNYLKSCIESLSTSYAEKYFKYTFQLVQKRVGIFIKGR